MSKSNLNPPPPTTSSVNTYTPGYPKCKLGMIAYGLALFIFGIWQIWTPLCLLAWGHRARAEAIAVVKAKSGFPDDILTTNTQIQAKLEPQDRSFVFWNEFRFRADNGQAIEVRAPIGSKLKPLYWLTDLDGLPTTDVVYYDLRQPKRVVFPLIISTWFAPGVFIIAGLVCFVIGGTLYYWARKPIELPHIKTES